MEDLEEWEIISHDDEDTTILFTEHVHNSSITTVINMNHFPLPLSESTQIARNSAMPNEKHNHEVLSEVMKENILHAEVAGMEPEDTKQQDTDIEEDNSKDSVMEETNGAKILCKKTLGGFLAIFSFAAAAIICIGKRWPHDQRLHFQNYTGDGKRKGMVQQSSNIMMQYQQQPEVIPSSPT